MSYRHLHKPPSPEQMLPRYPVRNGATLRLTFDCFYFDPGHAHDWHYHDHVNWPAPGYKHGDACQMAFPRDVDPRIPGHAVVVSSDDYTPINLPEEGYSEIQLVFEDTSHSSHITWTARIDTDGDGPNVVKFVIGVNFPTFSDNPVDLKFTAFIKGTDSETGDAMCDALCHGILSVLPGAPYPTS